MNKQCFPYGYREERKMYVEDNYKFIFKYIQLEDVSGTSNWCSGRKKMVSAAAMKHIILREKKENLNIYRNWETPISKEWAKKEEQAKMFEKE